MQTRRFTVGTAPINIKIRQSKRVQHAIANGAVLVDFVIGSNSVAIDGLVNVSVRGGL